MITFCHGKKIPNLIFLPSKFYEKIPKIVPQQLSLRFLHRIIGTFKSDTSTIKKKTMPISACALPPDDGNEEENLTRIQNKNNNKRKHVIC